MLWLYIRNGLKSCSYAQIISYISKTGSVTGKQYKESRYYDATCRGNKGP